MAGERPKAQRVFENTNFVFSGKTTFDKAFPMVKDMRIEVETTSEGSSFTSYKTIYTMQHKPAEYHDCRNSLCYNGGFSVGEILRKMVAEKLTHYEGTEICKGYEGSLKGKKRYRSCMSAWKVKADIVYTGVATPNN